MRIGIDEVQIHGHSTGTRQREINVLSQLLKQIAAQKWCGFVYVARDLDDRMISQLVGDAPNATVVKTPIPTLPTSMRVLRGLSHWRKQIAVDRLDLFHTSYYPVPRLPVPIVLTVNDVRFMRLPGTYPRSRWLFLRLSVPPSLRRASRIIAISQNTKDDLIEFFGVAPHKVDVIHIAADPRFCPVADKYELARVREKYSLPECFILYVGHLEPRKNLDRLVQAFVRLRAQKVVNHRLVILGKPYFGSEYVLDRVKQSDFASDVVFTGYVQDKDVPAVYTLADVLAFPSLHEGFGIPVLEAMACKVPVVTSNVSALPEVAGNAAILVDPYDVESIAKAIERVLNHEEIRGQLIKRGLKRVKHFDAKKVAMATVEVYKRTLGRAM